MISKICLGCNINFFTKFKLKLYCSRKCAKRHYYLTKEKDYSLKEKKCLNCEKKFILEKSNQKYCSYECRLIKSIIPSRQKYYIKNQLKIQLNTKKWSQNNKEYKRLYSKNYVRNPLKLKKYVQQYRILNPEKEKAHQILNTDKKKNPHLYNEICCICGKTENIDFHHPDYNQPFYVIPLCREHHVQIHQTN